MRSFLTVTFPNYDNPGLEEDEGVEVIVDELYELQVQIDHEDEVQLKDNVRFIVETLLASDIDQFYFFLSRCEYSYI
jgi:hypothetical protein